MKNVIMILCCCTLMLACNKPKDEAVTQPAESATPPQEEIGDAKYAEMGRLGLQQMSSGDIDGWVSAYADNAKYYWSGGDSLIGKKAITDYWKDRRGNVIESITFANDIFTPLKVNKPQRGPDAAGNWLLCWYQTTVTYKNKQTLKFWVHTDLHFDASDKIDIAVTYLDRAPIQAALAKK